MEYDLEILSKNYDFNKRDLEKVLRISDFLEDISNVEFLKKRLSLYGDTALNFTYFKDIPRLSVDLDFNYRHIDGKKDWGNVRYEIDNKIKRLLEIKGYKEFNINPSYPLCRFDVSYQNSQGLDDSFLIEIGYMRRYPILRKDTLIKFYHLGKKETFNLIAPVKEELFANKFITCLYRTSTRDIYDVYRISDMKFDREIFRKCAIIESLIEGKEPLNEIDISKKTTSMQFDTRLGNLLRVNEMKNLYEKMDH